MHLVALSEKVLELEKLEVVELEMLDVVVLEKPDVVDKEMPVLCVWMWQMCCRLCWCSG